MDHQPGPALHAYILAQATTMFDLMVKLYGSDYACEVMTTVLKLHNGARDMHNAAVKEIVGIPIDLEREYDAYFTRCEAANVVPLSFGRWHAAHTKEVGL